MIMDTLTVLSPTFAENFRSLNISRKLSYHLGGIFSNGASVTQKVFPSAGVRNIYQLIALVIERSHNAGKVLEISDLFLLCAGYLTLFGIIFMAYYFGQLATRAAALSRRMQVVFEPVKSLATVAKVGALLFMRIFFLPMCLGACVLSSLNVLLQQPKDTWVDFIATNVVGSVALTWVTGITYMLTVTLSVLQLREVLHPDILAKCIRPQVQYAVH
jgi:hypothetical protein